MLKIDADTSKLQIKIKQIRSLEIGKLNNYKSAILAKIQPIISQNFETQNQGKWQRLNPATIKQKQKQKFPATPLIKSGSLKKAVNSLSAQPIGQGKGLLISLGGDAKIKRIAQFQQFGTKTIPPRPFLFLNVRLSEVVTRLVVEQEIKSIKDQLK